MHLVRRRDVDDVDSLIRTQLCDGRVSVPAEFAQEARACLRIRVGCGNETDAGIGHERRQHEHERPPKADGTEA
jgi:hypothetical protein